MFSSDVQSSKNAVITALRCVQNMRDQLHVGVVESWPGFEDDLDEATSFLIASYSRLLSTNASDDHILPSRRLRRRVGR